MKQKPGCCSSSKLTHFGLIDNTELSSFSLHVIGTSETSYRSVKTDCNLKLSSSFQLPVLQIHVWMEAPVTVNGNKFQCACAAGYIGYTCGQKDIVEGRDDFLKQWNLSFFHKFIKVVRWVFLDRTA